MISFYRIQNLNRRKTFFLIFIFVIIMALLGLLLDEMLNTHIIFPIAVMIAIAHSFFAYTNGYRLVLTSLHARKANPDVYREKILIDVTREMSLAAGIPMPEVYIIPEKAPNALATGKNPENSYIAATEGLLDMLTREELQGVIAHEISHIRNYDILTMTVVSALAGAIVILSHWIWRTFFWTGGRRRREKGGSGIVILLAIFLAIIAPIIARLLALAVSRSREYLADASAAEITRNPLSLAKALEKISSYGGRMRLANEGNSHLFISDPLKRKLSQQEHLWAILFSTHPPINKRIKILREMAGEPV